MALNTLRGWLIAYDIADKRRLGRLHRFLKRHAVPVQYSVFCFEGSAGRLGRLVAEIRDYIDPTVDDVRIYQLPANAQYDVLGRGTLPSGTALFSARNAALPGLLLEPLI